MLLTISDGIMTVTLSGGAGAYHGCTYAPNTVSVAEAMEPGATITEEAQVILRSSDPDVYTDSIAAIDRMIIRARRRQELQTGPRVYINYQSHSGGVTGRSELIDGAVNLDPDPAGRIFDGGDAVRVFVTWTRRAYWEGALAQLVDGETLVNADGTAYYYESTLIEGALPTPAHIELENTSGTTDLVRHVWLGVNSHNAPSAQDWTWTNKSFSWTAPQDPDTALAEWTPSDGKLAQAKGDAFRWLAIFEGSGGATHDAYYRLAMYFDLTRLATGDEVLADTGSPTGTAILDLGVLPLPPGGHDESSSSVEIKLGVQSETVDGDDDIAWLQSMPADNLRHYRLTYQLEPNDTIVDDAIEDHAYVDTGSVHYPDVYRRFGPLRLYPNQTHGFMMCASASGGYDENITFDMSVWYRPRFLTVI